MECSQIGENYLEKSFDEQITNSIPLEKMIIPFTDDLTPAQKSHLKPAFIDDNTLAIDFEQHPDIHLTIRRQNIFASGAELIVNAANTHLGGGGGIDGAIHKEGGAAYALAHRELQTLFNSKYVEGYAAMISSGDLASKYKIDNVIVVAGPQGAASPSKETELYSCYLNALLLAEAQNKTSIAFPSISTGIFGFPRDRAAAISIKAVQDFVDTHPNAQLKTISIHFLPSDPSTVLDIYQNQIL